MSTSIQRKSLKVARRLAGQAGVMLRQALGSSFETGFKGEIDLVTELDLRSEELIVAGIRQAFPSHQVVAEEGTSHRTESEYRWLIDPLDGTTNYSHGFPWFCVSLALEEDGVVVMGLVHNPMSDEYFWAIRGEGAWLNQRRLSVSRQQHLEHAYLTTGFPYDIRSRPQGPLGIFSAFVLSTLAIRRAGSAALDLCYLAAGTFDGFWEEGLHPWDTAAGWLLVEEAGGQVTDFSGRPFHLESKEILASNGFLHAPMQATILRARQVVGEA